jgi:hypothetical protein
LSAQGQAHQFEVELAGRVLRQTSQARSVSRQSCLRLRISPTPLLATHAAITRSNNRTGPNTSHNNTWNARRIALSSLRGAA